MPSVPARQLSTRPHWRCLDLRKRQQKRQITRLWNKMHRIIYFNKLMAVITATVKWVKKVQQICRQVMHKAQQEQEQEQQQHRRTILVVWWITSLMRSCNSRLHLYQRHYPLTLINNILQIQLIVIKAVVKNVYTEKNSSLVVLHETCCFHRHVIASYALMMHHR